MSDENRLRPFWPVSGAIALLCIAFVAFKLARAPSTQEAMRGSLKELGLPELTTAFALHPDTCSIERSFWKWHVSCEGVPISFYQDRMLCNAGPQELAPRCRPMSGFAYRTIGMSILTGCHQTRAMTTAAMPLLVMVATSRARASLSARRWQSSGLRLIVSNEVCLSASRLRVARPQ